MWWLAGCRWWPAGLLEAVVIDVVVGLFRVKALH
jgi:hypothetical protein